jgi:hypothetical protein
MPGATSVVAPALGYAQQTDRRASLLERGLSNGQGSMWARPSYPLNFESGNLNSRARFIRRAQVGEDALVAGRFARVTYAAAMNNQPVG